LLHQFAKLLFLAVYWDVPEDPCPPRANKRSGRSPSLKSRDRRPASVRANSKQRPMLTPHLQTLSES
jgi:hypothetical protein